MKLKKIHLYILAAIVLLYAISFTEGNIEIKARWWYDPTMILICVLSVFISYCIVEELD